MSYHRGIFRGKTVVLVSEHFVLDKYAILHQIGHVLGCDHEEPNGINVCLLKYHFFLIVILGRIMYK